MRIKSSFALIVYCINAIAINNSIFIKKTNIVDVTITIIKHKNNLLKFSNLLYTFISKVNKKYSNQTNGINKSPHISVPYLNSPTMIKLAFSY